MESSPPLAESAAAPAGALAGRHADAGEPSAWRAFWRLIIFCLHRQARARQMVWIALALLGFTTTVVAIITAAGGWGLRSRRFAVATRLSRPVAGTPGSATTRPNVPITLRTFVSYDRVADEIQTWPALGVWPAPAAALQSAYAAAARAVLDRSGFAVFSNWLLFPVFVSFLMPLWSLSFATDTLGGERESGTLVWLLSRPLPRSAIYLAKFLALLPWAVGLNLGGFGLLCLAAGPPGALAFGCYWLAVLSATVAFASLFHLMSVCFRRPAVVALVYSFFLETVLGNMPGTMKRVSITFYTRCLMFERLEGLGVAPPEKPSVYLPVSASAAWGVLAGVTAGLLVLGMVIFSRSQYDDVT